MELGPNQKKWIEALRSGKYKQGRSHLHKIDENGKTSFCCLGVACDLFYEGIKLNSLCPQGRGIRVVYGDEVSYAPPEIVEILKLNDATGITRGEYAPGLAQRNDAGESFEYIASVLEENPELYFRRPA